MQATMRRGDARIEMLRVLGALCVFADHWMGDVQLVLNPDLARTGLWTTLEHYLGFYGMSLFIVISGLVFNWAWTNTGTWMAFVRRRIAALFPLYWWIAVPLIALSLAAHRMPITDLWKLPFWLTGLGILNSAIFQPVVHGWWYMTLALQMVLAYPFLRGIQQRLGVEAFVLLSAILSIASVYGLKVVGYDYAIDGFLGSRLLEFAMGMTIGVYVMPGTRGWPRISALVVMLIAALVWAAALQEVFPSVPLALVVVVLTCGVGRNLFGRLGRWASVGGGLSFPFYLSHSPWAKPIMGFLAVWVPQNMQVAMSAAISLIAAVLVAWGFQKSFTWATRRMTTTLIFSPYGRQREKA